MKKNYHKGHCQLKNCFYLCKMNIFVLDRDPKLATKYHCDKHVVKMVLETAQLLCGVHHMVEESSNAPYRLSHKNHPCSLWVRECIENYVWLCNFGIELSKEYTHRYYKRHKSQDVIEWCMRNQPNLLSKGHITKFALAMPSECRVDDPVQSYRNYYIQEKHGFAKWTNRETPYWFKKNNTKVIAN